MVSFLAERCLPGMYFDDSVNKCQPCGHGFYQPNEGSFSCISCGPDLTTKSNKAVSFQECRGKATKIILYITILEKGVFISFH